jgi:hypothetical protein
MLAGDQDAALVGDRTRGRLGPPAGGEVLAVDAIEEFDREMP